ncbi:MAG: hypothetical protein OEX03_08125 [Gammaproteobacteria bacterium]|nr:hypothetical protein [Gammaproteobacteria bacterium]
MSSVNGSCGVSEAQLLFERGIQEQQALRAQLSHALGTETASKTSLGQSISLSPTLSGQLSVAEPNKGQNIDLYA